MLVETDPTVVDNFLAPDLFDRLLAFAAAMPLKYGAKSASGVDPHGHLSYKPVHDAQQNLADISRFLPPQAPLLGAVWDYVRAHWIKRTFRLVRCYVNAYSYGMDGYSHTDSKRAGEITVIIYLCKSWHPDWGGETLAWRGERIWAARPKPNRAFLIPSNMWHRAAAVTRLCNDLRMVLVLKLRPQRADNFEHLSKWLVDNGALQHEHGSGGSLHDHLMRVYESLAGRGLDHSLCYGGGLHSIYGTNAFQQRLFAADEYTRARVAGEFGRGAEQLAYWFSVIGRPQTLNLAAQVLVRPDSKVDDTIVVQKTQAEDFVLSAADARQLCLIECANLADQEALAKWEHLQRLWERP